MFSLDVSTTRIYRLGFVNRLLKPILTYDPQLTRFTYVVQLKLGGSHVTYTL